MTRTIRLLFAFHATAFLAGFAVGCSGASRDGGTNGEPLPENTGAIVAKLTNVPSDVTCVEIDTSDYRNPMVRADVTPGADAEIRIAPLSPGYLYLWGVAYNVPCWEVGYGYGGSSSGSGSSSGGFSSSSSSGGSSSGSGGPVIDPPADAGVIVIGPDGGTGSNVTWEADGTSVEILPGQISQAEMHFHQLGGLDVNVSFDNCDPSANFYSGCDLDGGAPDAWTYDPDASIPVEDAGSATPAKKSR